MIIRIKRFVKDQRGVTAIEYGLIAGLIAVAILLSVGNIGTQLAATFDRVATAITPKT